MTNISESTAKAKTGFKRFMRNLLILVVILFIGVMFFLYYATYSTGQRAGIVLEISKRGAVFKTYEGKIDVLNFGSVKSDNQLSQTFEFSVPKNREDLINKLEEVSLTGERVQLRFEQKYAALPWRGETKYFVTSVKRMEDENLPEPKERDSTGDNYLE